MSVGSVSSATVMSGVATEMLANALQAVEQQVAQSLEAIASAPQPAHLGSSVDCYA